jgi:2'-5' RNA ligase
LVRQLEELPANPRLFVAVELPSDVLSALTRLQHELQRHVPGGLRWVRPEGIHLTLKFLGETPRERVPSIQGAISGSVGGIAPHEVALGELGTFGGRTPRVLWVNLGGETDSLLRLQRRVDSALDGLGYPSEKRPFSPHLTLARVKPEAGREVAEPLAAAVRSVSVPAAAIPVREVSLMLSKLGPGGAVYRRLEAWPLR